MCACTSVLRTPSLTHWSRETHICVSKLTIIVPDNGLSPGRCQAIIWTNTGILLTRNLGTNFSEIINEIHAFSLKKLLLKMSSAKWRQFCLGLNVLTHFEPHLAPLSTHYVLMCTRGGGIVWTGDYYISIVVSVWSNALTHWSLFEMDNISQMTFSNVFSLMKMFEVWL